MSSFQSPNARCIYFKLLLMLSRCGEIKRLVMGLDRYHKTPCGFCFVEYYTHQDTLDCLKYVGGTKLDERIIRTDLDPGFEEGRQYGYALKQYVLWLYILISTPDAANRVDRSVTSTEKNMTLAVVVTDEHTTSNDGAKKRNTGPVGNNVEGIWFDRRVTAFRISVKNGSELWRIEDIYICCQRSTRPSLIVKIV